MQKKRPKPTDDRFVCGVVIQVMREAPPPVEAAKIH
jgi:hypothetical protein